MNEKSDRKAIGLFHDASKKWNTNHQCLYPRCRKVPIGSHVIPRSVLALIAENGKVYGWNPPFHSIVQNAQNDQERERLYDEPRLFGIDEDNFPIKFPLFCEEHDGPVFASLELDGFSNLPKQVALLAYRAVCYNSWHPNPASTIFAWAEQHNILLPPSLSSPEKVAILEASFITDTLLTARQWLGSMVETQDYTQIESVTVSLAIPAWIASTSAFVPMTDDEDTDTLTAEDVLAFTLFPEKTRNSSYCVLSWFKGSQRGRHYKNTVLRLPKDELQDVLFATAFNKGNVCLSPPWWNSLTEEDKEILRQIHLD